MTRMATVKGDVGQAPFSYESGSAGGRARGVALSYERRMRISRAISCPCRRLDSIGIGADPAHTRTRISEERLWTVSQHFMEIPVVYHLGSSVELVTVRAAIQFTHDHAGDAVT